MDLRGVARTVNPMKAADHVGHLIDAGMSVMMIAKAAGVHKQTVSRILQQRPSFIYAEIERRILSVKPAFPECGLVSPVGARRRVQALMLAGWTIGEIADNSGASRNAIGRLIGCQTSTNAKTYWAIRKFFESNWQGPENLHQGSKVAITLAKRKGYLPALAWDDIDNPKESPKGVAA